MLPSCPLRIPQLLKHDMTCQNVGRSAAVAESGHKCPASVPWRSHLWRFLLQPANPQPTQQPQRPPVNRPRCQPHGPPHERPLPAHTGAAGPGLVMHTRPRRSCVKRFPTGPRPANLNERAPRASPTLVTTSPYIPDALSVSFRLSAVGIAVFPAQSCRQTGTG